MTEHADPSPEDFDPASNPILPRRSRAGPILFAGVALIIAAVLIGRTLPTSSGGAPQATAGPERPRAGAPAAPRTGEVQLRLVGAAPATWDPAAQSDAATAGTLAQVYEGLTAFDSASQVQPALAADWELEEDGLRAVFTLRPGLRFSDGSPLGAPDVVRSWLRLLDPTAPSPLASLLADVEGAEAYRTGSGPSDAVGIHARGEEVVVDFRRPAGHFVAATASPSLAVVPVGVPVGPGAAQLPPDLVVSGAYIPRTENDTTIRLEANPHYWAGMPAITAVDLVTDLEGRSPVDVYTAGELDWTPVAAADASWIRYDPDLGPQLRESRTLSVDYYGFDTTEPPFDDPLVRRAFSQAVDWDRLVELTSPESEPATSLVPPGIPGRNETDTSPPFDPAEARALLAQAGYPGGEGFPAVGLSSSGYEYDEAIARQLTQNLDVSVQVETMPFEDLITRLDTDPPQIWALTWIADYPDPFDFLGLLLETGSTNNYSRWSSAQYDAALEAAATTEDPGERSRHYAEAERILQQEAPLIPVSHGESWALSREGLLGAGESGLGLLRIAGMAWSE